MSLKEIIKNKHPNSDLRSLDKIWSTKSLKEIAELYAQQRVNEVFKTLKDLVEKNPHHDGYHESKLKAIELIKSIENEK